MAKVLVPIAMLLLWHLAGCPVIPNSLTWPGPAAREDWNVMCADYRAAGTRCSPLRLRPRRSKLHTLGAVKASYLQLHVCKTLD